MTLTTLITLNAILAAVVVYCLLLLLGYGIRSDRPASEAQIRPLHRRGRDRMAA